MSISIHSMVKLASLLAEFLYTNKRLDLPGIGSFLLGGPGLPDTESSRPGKNDTGEGIHFENNTAIKEAPELVSYIANTTGKIKALAAADLDSHLELARQFLNIGKPFLFEGIGTLIKQQIGDLSFIPGALLPEKVKEQGTQGSKEVMEAVEGEEPVSGFKNIFYGKKAKTNPKKTLGILLMLAGLAFAIWGGYTIYKKTISRDSDTVAEKVEEPAVPVRTEPVQPIDTTTATTSLIPSGNYKFVVETADKERALKRYSLLKGFGLDIKMETDDSMTFRLFFILPATPADTTRFIDSLQRLYTPAGGKAYVQQ